MKLKTKYRIVRDSYSGFEVQFRPWWYPFWLQCQGCNTHHTLENAKEYLAGQKQGVVYSE